MKELEQEINFIASDFQIEIMSKKDCSGKHNQIFNINKSKWLELKLFEKHGSNFHFENIMLSFNVTRLWINSCAFDITLQCNDKMSIDIASMDFMRFLWSVHIELRSSEIKYK